MVQHNQRLWVVCASALHTGWLHRGEVVKCDFCVIIRISFSEADVIVGGRCHMLRVKELHSHATPSRNDVKIALLSLCQSCTGWKYVTMWRNRDCDGSWLPHDFPSSITDRTVYNTWDVMLSKISFFGLFSSQFDQLFQCMYWKHSLRRLYGDQLTVWEEITPHCGWIRPGTCCQNF